MLYLGTALGAVISGALINVVGLPNLGWVGAPFGLAALGTLWFDHTTAQSVLTHAQGHVPGN